MAVAFVTNTGNPSGTSPFTTGSFSVTAGNAEIVFFDDYAASGRTLTMSGTGGTYTIANPPGSLSDTHTLAVFSCLSDSGGSQTATMTSSTVGDGVSGRFFEYSGVVTVSGNGNHQTNPGTGAGAVVGVATTVPTGSVLVALCQDQTNGSNTITSVGGGTDRANGTTWRVTEYAGSGGSITPSFTVATGTGHFAVLQLLLSPSAPASNNDFFAFMGR